MKNKKELTPRQRAIVEGLALVGTIAVMTMLVILLMMQNSV